MTPEQQQILDRLQKVLDPDTFEQIKQILLGIWSGAFAGAGFAEFVRRLLLEWAARQGTWMWLTLQEALGLSSAEASVAGAGGAGLAFTPLVIPLIVLLGGLLLPASKMGLGEIGLQSPAEAIYRDDCEEFYSALLDAFARVMNDYRAFKAAPTRKATSALLGEVANLQNACARFHKKCPDSARNSFVQSIQSYCSNVTSACLDWLATH
jgi:hypothetical protein